MTVSGQVNPSTPPVCEPAARTVGSPEQPHGEHPNGLAAGRSGSGAPIGPLERSPPSPGGKDAGGTPTSAASCLEVEWIYEYGLKQRLSRPIRCF
jgi:hypothetical protein